MIFYFFLVGIRGQTAPNASIITTNTTNTTTVVQTTTSTAITGIPPEIIPTGCPTCQKQFFSKYRETCQGFKFNKKNDLTDSAVHCICLDIDNNKGSSPRLYY